MNHLAKVSFLFAFGLLLALSPSMAQCLTPAPLPLGSDQLWNIVHNLCVPHELSAGNPWPCATVSVQPDEAHGFAVVKDLRGRSHYLLIPTAKITGVEDPKLLQVGAVNYWALAWNAKTFTEDSLHAPVSRDQLALGVNPKALRSQNQLHIHIDCVAPDVRALLKSTAFQKKWTPVVLRGRAFLAREIHNEDLGSANPFVIVASEVLGTLSATPERMAEQAVVLTGAVFSDHENGFYLLTNAAPLQGYGVNAESFLDRDCLVTTASPDPTRAHD